MSDGLPAFGVGAFRVDALRVELSRGADGDVELRVHTTAPSVGDPSQPITTRTRARFFVGPDELPREMLVDAVYDTLRAALLHELDEWFTVDGERTRDPHKERTP